MGKLTKSRIRHTRPTDKDQMLNDGSGLKLRIRKGGSRSWIIRLKHHGKPKIITLGTYPETSRSQGRLLTAQYQLKAEVIGCMVSFSAKSTG